MSNLSLFLFGNFKAIHDGEPVEGFRTNKVQALLIYLAVEPVISHQRQELMELLWPGLPVKSARVNLRQTIYQLRKAIPELMETDYKTIGLNAAYSLEADSRNFTDLLSEARTHDHSHLLTCEPCLDLLNKAADL